MMIMARDRDYPDLLEELRGKKVVVWTCNTCARLCCGVGGIVSAERLSSQLSEDGVNIISIFPVGACCVEKRPSPLAGDSDDSDVILALCCDIGASVARRATNKKIVNPIVTFGPGYLDENQVPHIESIVCGNTMIDETVQEAAERTGCLVGPFL